MGEKRIWGAPRGQQGSISDPVTEIIKQSRAESERRRLERQDSIDELKSEAEKKELEQKLSGEEKQRMAELEEENERLQGEVQKGEIEKVRVELGSKVDQLKQSLESGASKKSISEQIADIKQAATDMGLGGSKISEFQEMFALVEKLRPNKGLAEQVKEAKELLEPFQKEKTTELPAEISLKIREMDTNLQLRLEEMKDARAANDREWQLQLQKWQEEREDKRSLLEAEISARKEGNVLLANGIEKLGQVITAAKGAGVGTGTRAIASRVIEAAEGEAGETECPGCHTVIPIQGADTSAICAGCGTPYTISRIAKKVATEPVEASEVG